MLNEFDPASEQTS